MSLRHFSDACGKRGKTAHAYVAFDVACSSHARNDRTDGRIVENKSQSEISQGHRTGQIRNNSLDTGYALSKVVFDEITCAPVGFVEPGVSRDRPGKRPFVERHACDDCDIVGFAVGKQVVLGLLLENVVYHLDGVDETSFQSMQHISWLPRVNADSNTGYLPLAL